MELREKRRAATGGDRVTSKLMKSVSGIRGIVGDTLVPELIVKVGSAFSKYTKRGKVVIGRDSRPTGEAISKGLESVLILSGCDVIDLGIVPTPTVQLMVEELEASGGIVISASHNPVEWNAFKLINSRGTFLSPLEINKFFSMMESGIKYQRWDKIGGKSYNNESQNIHINRVLKVVDAEKIKKRKYKVVLDSVNGAGSEITPKLLYELGCDVVTLYCDNSGIFKRGPEPLVENLSGLSKMVVSESADIGFAQDPDADRLAIVDEKGVPIGEENTIALVVEHLLSIKPGRVVINLSTTKAVEDIAGRYGVKFKRTRVGEINVVDDMLKYGARIGGEGNGGVISPEVHYGRDSLVGIGYILEMMTERKMSLSQLVSDLPSYVMKKGKVRLSVNEISDQFFKDIEEMHCSEKISNIDGIRIDFVNDSAFKGGWAHLRASNTEPIFRIITEGRDKKQAEKIYSHFAKMLKNKPGMSV